MVFPLRPHERLVNLECSASALGPLPPPGTSYRGPAVGGTSPPGFGIYNLQMTYDAAIGGILLLGATGVGPLNGTQTWEFSGGNWTRILPVHSPESCYGSALAFDEVDNYTVYLGGANIGSGASCSSAGQTWVFRSGDWVELHPTASPSPRQAAAFTNDSADGYLLLFGGVNASCSNGVCNDSWTFVGGAWTQLSPSVTPPARAGAGMTYDAADGYVVMFGGTTDVSSLTDRYFWVAMLNDTWSFHGGQWTELHPVGAVPPEPYDDGFVYDAADRVAVYTCADNNASTAGGDPEIYWTFAGGNFTDGSSGVGPTPTLPPNRLAEGLAYDWKDGYVVLFGGTDASWQRLNDTWSYHAGTWQNLSPPARFASSLSARPPVVPVGATVSFVVSVTPVGNYSYAYAGLPPGCATQDTPWLNCTPTASGRFGIAVAVRNSTGGYANSSANLTVVPVLAIGVSIVPALVSLGGTSRISINASGGAAPYSYSYSRLPPGCRSADAPAIDCTPTQAGAFHPLLTVNDSIGETALTGANLTVVGPTTPSPPSVAWFVAAPNPVRVGEALTFLADVASVAPLAFSYTGLPPGCASRNASIVSCVPSLVGSFTTELRAGDPYGQVAFANVTVVVNASLPVANPLAIVLFLASPASVAVGAWTSFEVAVSGGRSPYAYNFTGLPSPCASRSSPQVVCQPSGPPGGYSVVVTVTDAAGASATQSTVLVVTAGPPTGETGSGGSVASGPTWTDFGLGVAVAALAVGVVAVAWRRPRPP